MKNPLSYQRTEYDCGPTTLINAVSFLFNREEIPPDVIKHIMMYGMDAYNCKGEFGKNGTSRMAMMFLGNWLNQFGKVKKFPVQCEYLTGPEVHIGQNSRIVAGLQQGGAAVARVRYGVWHYVLLTGLDEGCVYLFDPYFRRKPFKVEGVEILPDLVDANRRVTACLLNSEGKTPYAFGPSEERDAMILFNEKTRRTPAKTIEYFI
jgi:hypothetical protein